jgi:hypothetical protein
MKGEPTMANKQKPVHEIRLGAVKAAIWENKTQNGKRHNVTVTRLYKDDQEWKYSDSFGRDDLPLLDKVIDLCHTWIFQSVQTSDDVDRSTTQPETPGTTSNTK